MNRIAATLAALALSTASTFAQAPAAPAPIAPPSSGLLINYRYWPTQYVQFVGMELPYAMVSLEADTAGKQPIYYVTLTERATGKRIHYTNVEGLVAQAKAMGEEAHKTDIAVDGGDTQTNGSITTIRFSMADGKPVQWRFVQGSDISEQGAGLTPLPTSPIPIFAYREQAAVAGEGTALQIGDTVSTADVWNEISQPPYFIAYHGALSLSAHTIVFLPGKDTWTITSAPAALTAGSTWELDSATGDHRSLRIDKVEGAHVIVTGSDRYAPSIRFTLDATRTVDAWAVSSIRFAPVRDGDKHSATVAFGAADVSLLIGKKKVIATGTLAASGTPADHTVKLEFTTPTWAHGKPLTEETVTTPTTLTLISQPK